VGWRRPPRTRNDTEGDEADATELARSQESLTAFLHRQALALRLSEVDSAALRFLIESLNDDGYLEESLQELAIALAGLTTWSRSTSWCTASPWPSACCKPWSPWAWAPATWPSA
jgi:DNA-directed RNA polymerase specialized sigma54-like protein